MVNYSLDSNRKEKVVWPRYIENIISYLSDLFTIGEVCLQFLSTPNLIHQQYEATFKQDGNFQTHYAWNRATRGIWRKRQ